MSCDDSTDDSTSSSSSSSERVKVDVRAEQESELEDAKEEAGDEEQEKEEQEEEDEEDEDPDLSPTQVTLDSSEIFNTFASVLHRQPMFKWTDVSGAVSELSCVPQTLTDAIAKFDGKHQVRCKSKCTALRVGPGTTEETFEVVIEDTVLEYTTVVVVGFCKMLEVCLKGVLNCQDVCFDYWFDERPANGFNVLLPYPSVSSATRTVLHTHEAWHLATTMVFKVRPHRKQRLYLFLIHPPGCVKVETENDEKEEEKENGEYSKLSARLDALGARVRCLEDNLAAMLPPAKRKKSSASD